MNTILDTPVLCTVDVPSESQPQTRVPHSLTGGLPGSSVSELTAPSVQALARCGPHVALVLHGRCFHLEPQASSFSPVDKRPQSGSSLSVCLSVFALLLCPKVKKCSNVRGSQMYSDLTQLAFMGVGGVCVYTWKTTSSTELSRNKIGPASQFQICVPIISPSFKILP